MQPRIIVVGAGKWPLVGLCDLPMRFAIDEPQRELCSFGYPLSRGFELAAEVTSPEGQPLIVSNQSKRLILPLTEAMEKIQL